MKIYPNLLPALWAGLACLTCQPKKQTTSAPETSLKPAVALLAKTTYVVGNLIPVRFARPATQVRIHWDGKLIPVIQRTDSVAVPTTAEKTGIHQLIVRGTTTKESFSDTLSVELLANITPHEYQYSVLKTYPHQAGSFTEGLEFYRGALYESTGLNGKSQLMKTDLKTGQPLKIRSLSAQYFGEGITIVRDKIYQLTWTNGICFRYNLDFTPEKTFTYHTQGWGLTHRDTTLIMSDGSNKLYFFTPDFQQKGELAVYDNKGPVTNLNELEYVDGYAFANIWETNRIVQIDLTSGMVVAYLNMERILPLTIDTKENVLNGIAYQSQDRTFYITGKNWPTLTKIRLKGSVSAKRGNLVARNR